jgi:copper chaperone CopZ
MTDFELKDMTCGHCAGRVTRAIKAVDAQADVEIDLATRRVRIASAADAQAFAEALAEAGYPPSA